MLYQIQKALNPKQKLHFRLGKDIKLLVHCTVSDMIPAGAAVSL